MSRKLLSLPALLALAAAALLAQQADPPSRVARINLLSGSVSFRPGSVDEWTAATLNYPLTTGDHLWADDGSRVEIHAGSTAIRMSARTAMSVLNLDDRAVQLSLTDGSLHIRLRELADDESFEVDTPNVAITLLRPGEYRIDADGDAAATSVTVRAGTAQVTGPGAGFTVRPRQTGRATGMDSVQQYVGPALPQTEFDYWCEDRDRAEEEATASAQYVPRDMVGYEDLDRYGVWSEIPDYGPVWRPRTIDVGWAPYRYGHWVWVDPWGWTWVDDAPWGFAPFHYGRWVVAGGVWYWTPGRMVTGVRPVYAPALVVFVGTSRAGLTAWFPLGPREVYHPSYHASDYYVRQVNIRNVNVTNVTVVNNVYVNQRVPGAVTAVSRDTFVSARHIGRGGVVPIDSRDLEGGRVIGTAAPIPPQRASVLGHAGPAASRPPARMVDRTVVVQRTPPPAPVPFEQRRSALEANNGRPLDPGQMDRFRGDRRSVNVRTVPAAPGTQDRPTIEPRQERGPLRRPTPMPAEIAPPVQQQQQRQAPPPRIERPVERQAPPPRIERPVERQAPPPRVERPIERPVPQDRPRPVDRPAPAPTPAPAPRLERPAPDQRRDNREDRRREQKSERKDRPSRDEKKEK